MLYSEHHRYELEDRRHLSRVENEKESSHREQNTTGNQRTWDPSTDVRFKRGTIGDYYLFCGHSLAINTFFPGINEKFAGINIIYARKNIKESSES